MQDGRRLSRACFVHRQGSSQDTSVQAYVKRVPFAQTDNTILSARGVQTFENPGLIDRADAFRLYDRGKTQNVQELAVGFGSWLSETGKTTGVAVVGLSGLRISPRTAAVEQTDQLRLGAHENDFVEVNGRSLRLQNPVAGYSSFLGTPYVFTGYSEARSILRLPGDKTNFLIATVEGNPAKAAAELQRSHPKLLVRTRSQMANEASWHWISSTGAGGAILTSVILSVSMACVFVWFSTDRLLRTVRRDLVTMLLLGFSKGHLRIATALLVTAVAAIGGFLGVGLSAGFTTLISAQIAWIQVLTSVSAFAWMSCVFGAFAAAWFSSRFVNKISELEALRGSH